MRIDEIIAADGDPVFSFEFFPPKTEDGERNLYEALDALRALEPAFVSVTWGAGGSTREKTIEIVTNIRASHGLEAMAHFTCVGATVDDLRGALDQMRDASIDNVLTLRGDPPRGETEFVPTEGGLRYATELAQLAAGAYDFCLVGACYPEVHPEAPDRETDLAHLREKVDAGVKVLITQLFFDNEAYFRFVEDARAAGIDVPIVPGIMPITNAEQIKRFTRCAARRYPRRCSPRSTRAATIPPPSSTSASPTRRCSAPSCSRAARRGSTSTRSTAPRPRARSSPPCASSAPGSAAPAASRRSARSAPDDHTPIATTISITASLRCSGWLATSRIAARTRSASAAVFCRAKRSLTPTSAARRTHASIPTSARRGRPVDAHRQPRRQVVVDRGADEVVQRSERRRASVVEQREVLPVRVAVADQPVEDERFPEARQLAARNRRRAPQQLDRLADARPALGLVLAIGRDAERLADVLLMQDAGSARA